MGDPASRQGRGRGPRFPEVCVLDPWLFGALRDPAALRERAALFAGLAALTEG